MGNLYSHLPVVNNDYIEVVEVGDDGIGTPGTPAVETTEARLKHRSTALIDPRSPTIGVSRTPVEVVGEREKLRQERARKLQALEVPFVGQAIGKSNTVTTPLAVTPSGFLDPRSPTFDYKRTPLALGEKKTNVNIYDFESEQSDAPVGDMSLEDGDPVGKKVQELELQVPNQSGKMCRDLRKRLFVEKLNDSLTTTEDNKEN